MSEAKRPSSQGLPSDYTAASPGNRAGRGPQLGGWREVVARNGRDLEALAGVAEDVSDRLTVIGARLERALEDAAPDDPNRAPLLRIQEACHDAIALTREVLS